MTKSYNSFLEILYFLFIPQICMHECISIKSHENVKFSLFRVKITVQLKPISKSHFIFFIFDKLIILKVYLLITREQRFLHKLSVGL